MLQTSDSDCGPACLAMILAALRHRQAPAEIRRRLDPGRDGVTALDLRATAADFGVGMRAVRVDGGLATLRQARLPWPAVAHWAGNHFVVVERIRRDRVDIIDPATGRRRLTGGEFRAGFSGVLLFFSRPAGRSEPRVRPQQTDRPVGPVHTVLMPVLRESRAAIVRTLVASLLLMVAGLAVPLLTSQIINSVAAQAALKDRWLLTVPALAAVIGLLSLARGLTLFGLQRSLGRQLATRVVGRLFGATFRYFERHHAGDLAARVASADAIRDIVASAAVGAVLDATLSIGYLAVVAVLDPRLALVATAALVTQLAVAVAAGTRTGAIRREELLAEGQAHSQLVQAIESIAAIRVAGAEADVRGVWQRQYEQRVALASRRARAQTVADALSAANRIAAPVLLLIVASGHDGRSPGAVLGLAALAGAAVMSAASVGPHLLALAEVGPLTERLADVLQAPPEQPAPLPRAPRLRGDIELVNVGYRYQRRGPMALHGVNARIEAGMKVAVVGRSGSGKSTLMKLLTGLHPPTQGVIRFDGYDISQVDRASLRRQIGVVLQEPYLAATTIQEAITLGRPGTSDDAVREAARLAAIHDEVMSMPLGYGTPIGPGGTSLSGGQRQRVALARALLDAPAVLLLDEATSALDALTEGEVERAIRALPMTRVVIAHRPSTVADADLVLVIESGRLVECGAPADLYGPDGRLPRLTARDHATSALAR